MKYKLETIYSDERKEEDSKENLEKAIAEYLEQATSLKERYTMCSQDSFDKMQKKNRINSVPLGLIMNYAVFLYELADIAEFDMKHSENRQEAIKVLHQAKLLMQEAEVPETTPDQMVAEIEALRFQILTHLDQWEQEMSPE